ncbi:HalOD1 output domain-containing protein [Halomontanus rarus]|uniref:HalOD1 output domain-containing protein n=1 Tax=Halomontanus rarus TaxID=3034020 RepID=UPI001A985F13
MTEMTSESTQPTGGASYAVQYDRLDDEPLSVAVADAVATFTDTEVTELEPLHYSINADALERLFEPRPDGVRSGGSVTFSYNECQVTVGSSGEVVVEQE